MIDLNPAMDAHQSDVNTEDDLEEVQVMLLSQSKIAWLQEISFSVTKLLIIFVTCLVAVLSIIVRAEWYDILVRIVVTIMSLGFLGWLINWLLGRYLVEAKLVELEEGRMRKEKRRAAEEARVQFDEYDDNESHTIGIEA